MLVDLEAFRQTPLCAEPYPHCVVPDFLPAEAQSELTRDFPKLDVGGLYLPEAAPHGPSMAQLLEELEGEAVRGMVEQKLGLDLRGRPTLVTLRSRCQPRDGRIHADSKFKLATLLLYLNEPWMARGGRLRLLNSGADLEDYSAEVAPDFGTLVCFKVQDNSWHGHKPFVGPRRYVMVNYCYDRTLRDAEAARHRMSTRVKKVKRLFDGGAGMTGAGAIEAGFTRALDKADARGRSLSPLAAGRGAAGRCRPWHCRLALRAAGDRRHAGQARDAQFHPHLLLRGEPRGPSPFAPMSPPRSRARQ